MKRDNHKKNNRVKFCQLAINDKKKAVGQLKSMANALDHTKTIADTITALSEIFGVSEKTILRDLQNDIL